MAFKWHVLKVDFNRTMHVAGIATQSRSVHEPVFQQWVTQYFVYYSLLQSGLCKLHSIP